MRLAVGAARPCLPSTSSSQTCSIRPISLCLQTTSTTDHGNPYMKIGKRWREYQGLNNWSSLLDPLDDTLRAEILRYGEFAQATYTAFDHDPSSPAYGTCKFPKHSLLHDCGVSNPTYRVTANLHCTTAAELPLWAGLRDSWLSRKSAWVGFVAVCHDQAEISRLGRRDAVVALRGTVTPLEWLENLRATLTHLPCATAASHNKPMVERGFWSIFTTPGASHPSIRDQIRAEISRLLRSSNQIKPLSITLTGHSLGAALAILAAYDITSTFEDAPMVTVVSFGGPRVGNASFCRRLEERGIKVLRIVNTQDVVTKVPGFVEKYTSNKGVIPRWLLAKTGWVYADIGQELRVNGQPTANMAACHDLNVYLDLVNELRAPCPFRLKVEKSSWLPATMEAINGIRSQFWSA